MNNESRFPLTPSNPPQPNYPPPYKIVDGCLFLEQQAYDRKLCNFLPYIIRELTLDDGAEISKRLLLGGLRSNGEPLDEVEVAGSELASFSWVSDKWGSDCILEIGALVKDHIRYAIQQTAVKAEKQTVYAVTGWKKISGQWVFLLPGSDTQTVRLPDKLSRYEKGEKIDRTSFFVVKDLLEHPPASRPLIFLLLAYTFLTPLNHFLHMADCEPKFVFTLLGRTGARKSTMAALFLSFFGRFTASELPLSFRDTPNSITHYAFALKDVLTCVDDFHPSSRQEEQKLTTTAQAIIRAYGDRVGRGRLKADSTPMASRPPQGNAIITAENAPDIGESGMARTFIYEMKADEVDLKMLSFFQNEAAKGVFRSFMLTYTEWIKAKYLRDDGTENRFLDCLKKLFERYRQEFSAAGIPCHGRLPEIVSWFRIGMIMFLSFLKDQDLLTADQVNALEDEFISMLYELTQKQAESIDRDRPAHIFIRKLYALIESGQVVVLKKSEAPLCEPKDYIGFEDDNYFYLNTEAAHRAVKKLCDDQGEAFSVNTHGLLKALAEEGLIDTQGGENTKSVRFGNKIKRVFCLRKEAAQKVVDATML